MNARRVAAKLSLVVPFALALPACLGEPMDAVDQSPSIETRQSAQVSIPPPDHDDNNNGGGSSSSGGGSSSGPPTLGVVFENCTSDTRRNEMRDALKDILDNWSTFEANLNARGLTGDHNCMLNRLTDNGKVNCEACNDPDLAGHSSLVGKTANVCRVWASSVEDDYSGSSTDSVEKRKVCWASILMHEFRHTCLSFEDGAETADNAARETLNDLYGQSLDLDSDCNQDM